MKFFVRFSEKTEDKRITNFSDNDSAMLTLKDVVAKNPSICRDHLSILSSGIYFSKWIDRSDRMRVAETDASRSTVTRERCLRTIILSLLGFHVSKET